MASGDTKTEALLNILGSGGDASEYRGCCNTKSQNYILDAIDRVQKVEDDVEEIKNNPDVVDIVATYADLQAYDTQHLTDRDIIRVLQDETHDGESTYYRYNKQSDTWTYIGESKQYDDFVGTDGTAAGEAGLVPAPATTDAGKFLKADGTWAEAGGGGISALTTADYNYPANSPNGLAPWLLDPGLYYTTESMNIYSNSGSSSPSGSNAFYVAKTWNGAKSVLRLINDSWSYTDYTSAGASSTSYSLLGTNKIQQTTGTSTYEVMSQKAVTDTLFKDNNTAKVQIGSGADASGGASYYTAVAIGSDAKATGDYGTAVGSTSCTASGDSAVAIGRSSAKAKGAISIGRAAEASSAGSIAIGGYSGSSNNAFASYNGSIAIGVGSMPTAAGEFNIGDRTSTYGYNNSAYRLLSGVYDGQTAHDAATLAQGNTLATSAPTTSTVGVLGQLYTDTTNMHTYQCTAISGSTYTWTQRW